MPRLTKIVPPGRGNTFDSGAETAVVTNEKLASRTCAASSVVTLPRKACTLDWVTGLRMGASSVAAARPTSISCETVKRLNDEGVLLIGTWAGRATGTEKIAPAIRALEAVRNVDAIITA
jgi:hypothetical protein